MNRTNVRNYVEAFAFEDLFANELLWNRLRATVSVEVDSTAHSLIGVAEKSGVQVYRCPPLDNGTLTPYSNSH